MNCPNHPENEERRATLWRRIVTQNEHGDVVRWHALCEECGNNIWPRFDDKRAAWEKAQNGEYDSIHHNDRKWRQTFPEPKYDYERRGK